MSDRIESLWQIQEKGTDTKEHSKFQKQVEVWPWRKVIVLIVIVVVDVDIVVRVCDVVCTEPAFSDISLVIIFRTQQ